MSIMDLKPESGHACAQTWCRFGIARHLRLTAGEKKGK